MEKGKCMLKTLTQLHSPELLHTLAAMGHGDELALVDAHFPAVSMARRLVRLDGADLPDAPACGLRFAHIPPCQVRFLRWAKPR